MTIPPNDEKPFRPSTELQNEWLVDADRNHMISFTPPPAEMLDWAQTMHALIKSYLINENPFGLSIEQADPTLEDAAEARHRLHKKPGRES